ncbi:hypothetical protein ABQE57_22255 [Mycolicibacterium elephantis]
MFDTGPLRHFAAQGWLGVLQFLAEGRPVFIPDVVERELSEAVQHVTAVQSVLEADWIDVYRSTDYEYLQAFSSYADRLVSGTKNLGECGVLAMGEIHGYEVVIDDAIPFRIAEEKGIRVTATVPLLCRGIAAGRLTTVMVEALADSLLEGEYYLPFEKGGFRSHVLEHGLLDWDQIS